MSNLMSVQEAADSLGFTVQHIRKLIRSGQLQGQKIGHQWVLDSMAIQQFKNEYGIRVSAKLATTAPKILSPSVKALSFFSGAMGLDLGLEMEGIEVILACEVDKQARLTIQKNKPETPLIGDIRDYTAQQIKQIAGLSENEDIDLIVGGSPCQAFSTAGNRLGFNDERGNVFLTFINLIRQLRPKYAVIENVRGLLSAPLTHRPHNLRGKGHAPLTSDELPGGALRHVIETLESSGYGLSFNLYNSANFGAPQIRERLIIICNRDGEELPYLEPTHAENGQFGLKPWVTFREAVDDLGDIKHEYVQFPEKRLKYYRLLKPGQNWRNLPLELQQEALGKSYYAGGGKTGFLRRIAWDAPCPTLVTHPAMPATDLAHPELDRPLSVQEYKRVQEFPNNWFIAGKILDQYKQIGNAVPINLGRAIGRLIMNHIQGKPIQQYNNFLYSRYLNCDYKSWKTQNMLSKPSEQLKLFA